ncbi:Cys-tRNA(Pro) deacylase [Acidocella sp.]|uniref:Cys-tRNA(Pro) deacylase n=1 Tax=Acidocella sp. TaxID=50710 RepID=UPI003CFD5531
MSTGTPATQFLRAAKIPFEILEYDYEPGHDRVALQAAAALGLPPGQLLKTLMLEVDRAPVCAVLPGERSLSMKFAAAAAAGKSAAMMPPEKAERLTGYHTGGISPFGQRKRVPVLFEESALGFGKVAINGGRRGLILLLAPDAACRAVGAKTCRLCAQD